MGPGAPNVSAVGEILLILFAWAFFYGWMISVLFIRTEVWRGCDFILRGMLMVVAGMSAGLVLAVAILSAFIGFGPRSLFLLQVTHVLAAAGLVWLIRVQKRKRSPGFR